MEILQQENKIVIPEFVTHAPISKSKYMKINSQYIYNSNLNRFARNNMVSFLHTYLAEYIPSNFKIERFPIQIGLNFYVPRNYGSVSRRKNKETGKYQIYWKPPKDDYKINWDIGNYGYIWLKTFLDTLQIVNAIPDDNASYVSSEGPANYIEVNSFSDRKLEFFINYI